MKQSDVVKDEFAPLWGPGFHVLTLDVIKTLCVERFPLSSTRASLMSALEIAVETLTENEIDGDIWLDGSFVTEKINPSDIDFVFVVKSSVYDGGTSQQRRLLDGLIDDCWLPDVCDTNVAFIDPPELSNSSDLLRHWQDRLGYSSDRLVPKGIVVVTVGSRGA